MGLTEGKRMGARRKERRETVRQEGNLSERSVRLIEKKEILMIG